MKLSTAITLLLAGVAVAYPQNRGNGTNNNNGNNGNNNNGNNNNGNNNNGNNNNGNNNNGNNGNNNGNSNSGAPQDGSNDTNQQGRVDQNTALLMSTAVSAWMRDTGVVSNFLDNGASYNDESTFKNQALIAHSAEVDELTHKNVLDQFMPNNKNVQMANGTLTNGAFQLVVDQLQRMADEGRSAMDGIDIINKDRCVNVLPNIDMYMREAALTIGNGQGVQQSVRPSACANIEPGQNGALKVGQAPPGYVNGKLQNGNSNTNPNIPATPADDDPK